MTTQPQITFADTDKLGLRDFALRLESFMATESRFVDDGALVLSLNGPFGSGKTTFLEMWRHELAERRKAGLALPMPIILNAWESDFCGDPLLAMVSAISLTLGEHRDARDKRRAEELREAAKDVANFALGLVGGVVKASGVDPIAAQKFAEEKKQARKAPPKHQDLLILYEKRFSALKHLKDVLSAAFGGTRLNALIMVDELDRCRPNYAIEYLETIKHVFDVPGLAFVLAVDKGQLQSSAKALFGNDLNFNEYYRKFAHRNVELPAASEQGINRLSHHYAQTILEVASGEFRRSSMLKIGDRIRNIIEIAVALQLLPRQLREVFRLMGHLLSGGENQRGKLLWGYGAAAILLSALFAVKPDLYRRLGSGNATMSDFEQLFALFSNERDRHWWGSIIITGYQLVNEEKTEKLFQEFVRLGALPAVMSDRAYRRDLGQFAMAWGDGGNQPGIKRTFEDLEALKSFGTE